MIDEKQVEQIVEKLIERVNKANTLFLKSIGSSIKEIGELTPTEAHQLVQMLKYGDSYDRLIKEISKYTDMNVKDIDKIFKVYAKKDQQFYKKFYQYRNKPFISYEKNVALQNQTKALSNVVSNQMYNFTRDNVLGYTINGRFYNLRDTYNRVLDEAFINVSQGKLTFDSAMSSILEDIGGSGLKTLEYESGRSMRLDSAVRMHLKGRLRELHNENQKIMGEEFNANGVEITVHANPAPDHQDIQGRQFSNEEFEKLQKDGIAKDINDREYDLHLELKNGETAEGFRPISAYNCYHVTMSIVLGVSKPRYNDEQLQKIIDDNNKGFELDGEHYTNYQGTQMQRSIEKAIREQKDIQILGKSSGNEELIAKSEEQIRILTNKYYELSKKSGLPTKLERIRVDNYIPVAKK